MRRRVISENYKTCGHQAFFNRIIKRVPRLETRVSKFADRVENFKGPKRVECFRALLV